jgi:hexulose-6-phosphate isomerase
MNRIGIMQGRLLRPIGESIQRFPADAWEQEFARAAQAGLFCIEWIYEVYGAEKNPLARDEGIETLRRLSEESGVAVRSVCADYFMDRPLLRSEGDSRAERIAVLRWLIERCGLLGADRIVIPFVDVSRIETSAEADEVVAMLSSVVDDADKNAVELHLETSLPPGDFAALLAKLPHPRVKANYDSGNSASLGYDVRDEFSAYGDRIGSVHIKDRIRGGGTVPLGTGDADLPALFRGLRTIGYDRELIMQVARGAAGDEVNWAKKNRNFVEARLKEAA